MSSFHEKQKDEVTRKHATNPRSGSEAAKSEQLDIHHVYALKLYNAAIRAFKDLVKEEKATPLMSILSCFLFITIETIRDNVFAAMTLFARGMALIRHFEAPSSQDKGKCMLPSVIFFSKRY